MYKVFTRQEVEQLKFNGEMEVPLQIEKPQWTGLATVIADDVGLKVIDITDVDPTIRRLVIGDYFLRFQIEGE